MSTQVSHTHESEHITDEQASEEDAAPLPSSIPFQNLALTPHSRVHHSRYTAYSIVPAQSLSRTSRKDHFKYQGIRSRIEDDSESSRYSTNSHFARLVASIAMDGSTRKELISSGQELSQDQLDRSINGEVFWIEILKVKFNASKVRFLSNLSALTIVVHFLI